MERQGFLNPMENKEVGTAVGRSNSVGELLGSPASLDVNDNCQADCCRRPLNGILSYLKDRLEKIHQTYMEPT